MISCLSWNNETPHVVSYNIWSHELALVSGNGLCHYSHVKTILSKPASRANAADVEVRQLQATGKRIAADKKSIVRFLAATGMYTAAGKLKPQFR